MGILHTLAYRLFIHPLRKYPGPFVARITDLFGFSYAVTRSLHLKTWEGHQKYGPVVRHGPNKLTFNSAQALQDIYNNDKIIKSHVYGACQLEPGVDSVFSVRDMNDHRRKRKLVGQALTERSMRTFEPLMAEQVDVFLGILARSSQSSTAVDMTPCCKRLGVDIIGLLTFGRHLNTQTNPRYRFMVDNLSWANYQSNILFQFPLLASMGVPQILYILSYVEFSKYMKQLENLVMGRLAQDRDAHHDLYSVTGGAFSTESPKGIQASEFWSEALFFFPAGGDTASTAVAGLFFYLSRNPKIYKKLAEEIRSNFSKGSEIQGPRLARCQYLRACIDETLRMSPPVSGTPWRELRSGEDGPLIVDGHVIPRGTQVGVSIYSLHRNENYFSDPDVYLPERWLVEDEAVRSKMNSAFAAFSSGSRGCAGKAMAYLEVSLVVAKTLWYFDFDKAPGRMGWLGGGSPRNVGRRGKVDEFQLYDTFSSTHEGPNLVFRPRGDHWKEIGMTE
ncbi:cytochrome P450 [Xylaria grammica]|nr:cytochrome P450 [Xylaria grammica]